MKMYSWLPPFLLVLSSFDDCQGQFDFPFDCSDGLEFSDEHQKCVIKCEPGTVYNDDSRSCFDMCTEPQYFDASTGNCEDCPENQEYDPNLGECVRGRLDDCVEIDVTKIVKADDVDIRAVGDNCPKKKCEDYADQGFRCVPPHVCRNSTIVTDGGGLVDIRYTSDVEPTCCTERKGKIDLADFKCNKNRKVCCQHPDYSLEPCGINSKCWFPGKPSKGEYDECGRIITDTDLKFIDSSKKGGKLSDASIVQPGEFPHMCLIYRVVDGVNTYLGGASIIDRNKFLTVAHKFLLVKSSGKVDLVNDPSIYVRCGEHNVKLNDDLLEFQESRVVKVHLHPDYSGSSLKNNIAVLETELNMIYQKHISRVCLPEPGKTFEGLRDCYSTGWGSSEIIKDNADAYYSDILRKVQLEVADRTQCSRTLNNLDRLKSRNKKFVLYDSFMCIGGQKNEDTCEGDGGSPHVCNIDNKWVQVGAVAFGFGCGEGIPSIYSSVSDSMCFIDWVMSCVPLSRDNVNFKDNVNIGTKSSSFQSMNKLKSRDCRDWLNKHPKLKNKCNVEYV